MYKYYSIKELIYTPMCVHLIVAAYIWTLLYNVYTHIYLYIIFDIYVF